MKENIILSPFAREEAQHAFSLPLSSNLLCVERVILLSQMSLKEEEEEFSDFEELMVPLDELLARIHPTATTRPTPNREQRVTENVSDLVRDWNSALERGDDEAARSIKGKLEAIIPSHSPPPLAAKVVKNHQ